MLVRVAAGLSWVQALGFGLPCLLAIQNLRTGRDLPMILGFRAFGKKSDLAGVGAGPERSYLSGSTFSLPTGVGHGKS